MSCPSLTFTFPPASFTFSGSPTTSFRPSHPSHPPHPSHLSLVPPIHSCFAQIQGRNPPLRHRHVRPLRTRRCSHVMVTTRWVKTRPRRWRWWWRTGRGRGGQHAEPAWCGARVRVASNGGGRGRALHTRRREHVACFARGADGDSSAAASDTCRGGGLYWIRRRVFSDRSERDAPHNALFLHCQ